jgi:hypothetical protein
VRDVIDALADIGEPAAIAALGAVIEESVSARETERDAREFRLQLLLARHTLGEHTWRKFALAGGCAAIPLRLLQFVPASADTLLEQRCPDLRTRLRSIRDRPPTAAPASDEYRIQTERASRARDLLISLERPQSPPPVAEPNDHEDDESPDPRKLGAYVRNLLQGSSEDSVAMRGLVKFGTKDTYLQLRAKLDEADESARGRISGLMEVVTFHEAATWHLSPRYWDSWWRVNGALSRTQWAEEALAQRRLSRGGLVNEARAPARAAEYLLSIGHNSAELVSRLARHRSWFVRLTVANTVAAYDRKRAGALMIREFGGRYIGACRRADDMLRELTRRDYYADCLDPTKRQQAAAYWTSVLEELRQSS